MKLLLLLLVDFAFMCLILGLQTMSKDETKHFEELHNILLNKSMQFQYEINQKQRRENKFLEECNLMLVVNWDPKNDDYNRCDKITFYNALRKVMASSGPALQVSTLIPVSLFIPYIAYFLTTG